MELFWTIFDKTDQKDNLGHAELFWTKHGKSEPHRARPIKANKHQLGLDQSYCINQDHT